ncbi:uncharacterized protein LOC114757215 [Neltuma alba]|uniref:uncharacterized protein LOC114757215 n=1 Tax=Neltuma alba TaxID=207710 RepID=UPI0010A470EF|nr:uncharacterized protein LOC114757215 [Prosopis alba]
MRKSQEGRALRQFTLSTGKSAGRNSSGRITVFHRGGGSKRLQRRIDLKRSTSLISFLLLIALFSFFHFLWGKIPLLWCSSVLLEWALFAMGDLSLSVGGDGSGPSSSTRPPFDLNMPPEEEEPARSFDLNRPGDEPGPSPEEELLYLKEEKLRLKQAFQQAIQDFERLREAIDQSQESNPQSASALGEKLSGLGQKFKDLERMQERLCQLESDCYKTVRDSRN